MTDRPIIFSGPMVKALLDGRKTQTRRFFAIKGHRGYFQFGPSDTKGCDWTFRRADHVWEDYTHEMLLSKLPIATGDRLYVREAFCLNPAVRHIDRTKNVIFRANVPTSEPPLGDALTIERLIWLEAQALKWKPSIHMPRWASRLTLTVTDVRVQRLQDTSEADAIAEGVEDVSADWLVAKPAYRAYGQTACFTGAAAARLSFMTLWNSLHGPEAWDANPWIAAYTFTVQRGNIDQIENASKPTTHRQRGGYTGGV